MYWLVMIMSITGMPDMTMEIKMGNSFYCNIARDKFVEGNPPQVAFGNEYNVSNIESITCVKKKAQLT